jgi:hypothetical protein
MAPFQFITDDCLRVGTCVCGFCKRMWITSTEIIRDCENGDCRRVAETNCPRFGYKVCKNHAHANCHNHVKGAECTTRLHLDLRPHTPEWLRGVKTNGDG